MRFSKKKSEQKSGRNGGGMDLEQIMGREEKRREEEATNPWARLQSQRPILNNMMVGQP